MIVDCFESRHKKNGIRDKNNGLRKQFQTSQTYFLRSPAANWRKKITKTEKGTKIARFVLPSTTMFTCFNRPENKNQTVCLHCIFFLF